METVNLRVCRSSWFHLRNFTGN